NNNNNNNNNNSSSNSSRQVKGVSTWSAAAIAMGVLKDALGSQMCENESVFHLWQWLKSISLLTQDDKILELWKDVTVFEAIADALGKKEVEDANNRSTLYPTQQNASEVLLLASSSARPNKRKATRWALEIIIMDLMEWAVHGHRIWQYVPSINPSSSATSATMESKTEDRENANTGVTPSNDDTQKNEQFKWNNNLSKLVQFVEQFVDVEKDLKIWKRVVVLLLQNRKAWRRLGISGNTYGVDLLKSFLVDLLMDEFFMDKVLTLLTGEESIIISSMIIAELQERPPCPNLCPNGVRTFLKQTLGAGFSDYIGVGAGL
ncbi:hypothetical protein RFI_23870, partial [Reticulomyxa filosa]